jgi:hypothetical protein
MGQQQNKDNPLEAVEQFRRSMEKGREEYRKQRYDWVIRGELRGLKSDPKSYKELGITPEIINKNREQLMKAYEESRKFLQQRYNPVPLGTTPKGSAGGQIDVYKDRRLKLKKILENFPDDNKMYGYGYYGEGYRYPKLTDTRDIVIQIEAGPRTLVGYASTHQWTTAYYLNKKAAQRNEWIKFLQDEIPKLRAKYLGVSVENLSEPTSRRRHARTLRLLEENPEFAAFKALETANDEELLRAYYEGSQAALRRAMKKLAPQAKK